MQGPGCRQCPVGMGLAWRWRRGVAGALACISAMRWRGCPEVPAVSHGVASWTACGRIIGGAVLQCGLLALP